MSKSSCAITFNFKHFHTILNKRYCKEWKGWQNISVEDYRVNNISINSNQALKLFEDLGYSDKEIVELYQNDSNSLQVTIKLPEKLFKRTGIQCVKLETTMLRSFP